MGCAFIMAETMFLKKTDNKTVTVLQMHVIRIACVEKTPSIFSKEANEAERLSSKNGRQKLPLKKTCHMKKNDNDMPSRIHQGQKKHLGLRRSAQALSSLSFSKHKETQSSKSWG